MEALEKMLTRHEKEMNDLMNKQYVTWQALREQYGESIPLAVETEWNNRYGNTALHSLEAQQAAERQAHPEDPRSYAHLDESSEEQQAKINDMISPEAYEQYLQSQKQQPSMEDFLAKQQAEEKKLLDELRSAVARDGKTEFERMQEEAEKKQRERSQGGIEY